VDALSTARLGVRYGGVVNESGPAADVAVIGLGPVGTVLAGLLGKQGLSVIAFDKLDDVFPLPRAAHIDHTGLRTIQQLGCLDTLLPEMIENPGLDLVAADGSLIGRIPGAGPNPSNLPASMYFHQPGFDRELRRAVRQMPNVELRLGTEVTGVERTKGGIRVRGTSATGSGIDVEARYAVAADGASSGIREALGVGLTDLRFHERWLVVDLLLRRRLDSLPDRAVTYADPSRPLGFVPMPAPRCRFEIMLREDEEASQMQDPAVVEQLLAAWVPVGAAEVERSAVYYFHGLIAQSWRADRILLVGDAAHQMPPFLGQGMNSGLRDASNLAWKLARVIEERSPDSLLDTYELERKPHVCSIVEASVRIGKLVCASDRDQAVAHNGGSVDSPDLRRSGVSFRLPPLEPGPLVLSGGGHLGTQVLGDDGQGRFDDVVGYRFLVLSRDCSVLGQAGDWWRNELGALVCTPESFPDFTASLEAWLDRLGTATVVVRPDRYILASGPNLGAISEQLEGMLTSPTPLEA